MDRNRRNARALLASIANEITQSRTIKIVCPFCGGGSSQEHSLSLTLLDSGAAYKCHRAGCGEAGRVGGSILDPPLGRTSNFQPRELGIPIRGLRPHDRWMHYYNLMVGSSVLDPLYAGLAVSRDDPRVLVTTCHDLFGRHAGHQTRLGYPGEGGKVVKTFKVKDGPFYASIATPKRTNELAPMVIVEDFLSACCVAACGYHGLALLGTYLSPQLADEIAEYQDLTAYAAPICIALDPGAESAAYRALNTLKGAVNTYVTVRALGMDLKNMPMHDQQNVVDSMFPHHHEDHCP